MKKILVVFWAMLCLTQASFAQIEKVFTIPYGDNPEVGKYAQVNSIRMYYEIYGSGMPLVLIHGNGGRSNRWPIKLIFLKNNTK